LLIGLADEPVRPPGRSPQQLGFDSSTPIGVMIVAVAAARKTGESWNAIGVALGTARQAAHRKFSR
jgi:hypothetical protein